MVIGDFTRIGLYICIPENSNSVNIEDIIKDVALLTAEKLKIQVKLLQLVIKADRFMSNIYP